LASNPLILAFDTSAAHCAAVLLCGDTVLAHAHEDMDKGQVERLFPLLEDVLASANKTWADLNAIGVCTGPGNFTGVRIGVSSARGLALSLDIPAIGVSMLEALAFGHSGPSISILDARRKRFFTQIFEDGDQVSEPKLTTPEELVLVELPINCVTELDFQNPQNIPQIPVHAVAQIAAQRMAMDNPRPAPLYLRAPNAALPTEQPPTILP